MTIALLAAALALLTAAHANARVPQRTAEDAITADLHRAAKAARYEQAHGGIVCRTVGVGARCATPRMRELSKRLVEARFRPAGPRAVRTALCIVGRESGFNPSARSRTGDWGLGQINYVAHHRRWDFSRILDPGYNVGVMWSMSRGGTWWGPWQGGAYTC